MPRPKKDGLKRDKRLTVYLTETEYDTVHAVAEHDNRAMTDAVIGALRDWLGRLIEPPESWRSAKYEAVMKEQSLTVRGYVCRNGHPFWIDAVEGFAPRFCPMCGSQTEIKRAWGGTVKRGI